MRGLNNVVAQELEVFGLGMIISLALLASEIFLLGMYLSQWKRGVSTRKLQPYLVMIYVSMFCSLGAGFLTFYRGEEYTVGLAFQGLVLISLFPNFVILVIVALTLALRGTA